jgi:hypothetical protein
MGEEDGKVLQYYIFKLYVHLMPVAVIVPFDK